MSAVPNIPESISRDSDSGPGAASEHSQRSKEATINGHERVTSGTTNGTNGTLAANGAKAEWLLHDVPIENQRPMRVIVIGAGYSGIYLGIRIPERIRNCELVIYEKNEGVGGTW
jgi:hypothetical protein